MKSAIWISNSTTLRTSKLTLDNDNVYIDSSIEYDKKTSTEWSDIIFNKSSLVKSGSYLALDFDGVCSNNIHLVELAEHIGQKKTAEEISTIHEREKSEKKVEETIKNLGHFCKGLPYYAFQQIALTTEIRPSIIQIINEARKMGIPIAIITNGIAEFVKICLAGKNINVDQIWGTQLGFKDNICTGEIYGSMAKVNSKGTIINALCSLFGAKPIVIGNGMNDVEMIKNAFEKDGYSFLLRKQDEAAEEIRSFCSPSPELINPENNFHNRVIEILKVYSSNSP